MAKKKTLKTFELNKNCSMFVNGNYFTDTNFAIKRNLIKTSSELLNNALASEVNCRYYNGSMVTADKTELHEIDNLVLEYITSYNTNTDELKELDLYSYFDKGNKTESLQLFYSMDKNFITLIKTLYLDIFRSAADFFDVKKINYYQSERFSAVGVFFDNECVGVIMPCMCRDSLPSGLKIIKDTGNEIIPLDI